MLRQDLLEFGKTTWILIFVRLLFSEARATFGKRLKDRADRG
jgi:hypothetical protein